MKLSEYSPDTPAGSKTHDLNLSKLWLCRELKRFGLDQFDNVYILGSWYGSMPMFLLNKHIVFDQCFCVDWNHEKTSYVNKLNLPNVQAIEQDANTIKYKGNQILVINTSTNDITGRDWLRNIPTGSVVAMQGRDHQHEFSNGIETLQAFNRAYPLEETLMLDSLPLTGVDGEIYSRFMKVGLA